MFVLVELLQNLSFHSVYTRSEWKDSPETTVTVLSFNLSLVDED